LPCARRVPTRGMSNAVFASFNQAGSEDRNRGKERLMPTEIRQYRDTDESALVECIKELQAYVASLDDLQRIRLPADFDGDRYVQRLLEKVIAQNGVIYLADDGGKVVGCIAGAISQRTEDDDLDGYPTKDGKILELHVKLGQRGQHIGLRLMQALEQHFRAAGCIGCTVDCFAPNVDAHDFYHNVGYADRDITLLKIL